MLIIHSCSFSSHATQPPSVSSNKRAANDEPAASAASEDESPMRDPAVPSQGQIAQPNAMMSNPVIRRYTAESLGVAQQLLNK